MLTQARWIAPAGESTYTRGYGRFLDRHAARYGRNHPIIASEYYNQPLDASRGLFDRRRLAFTPAPPSTNDRQPATSHLLYADGAPVPANEATIHIFNAFLAAERRKPADSAELKAWHQKQANQDST